MTSQHVIAIDLGGTKLLAGLVDREGVALRRTVRPTDLSGEDALLDQIEHAIGEVGSDGFGALGVGIPSTIDQRTGCAVSSVNIPLADVDLRRQLERRFGVPVMIENDGNAATLAEHRLGAGRGTRHMVMLTLGTGVGGGLILDGRLYRGAVGAAGELGHITIDVDGPPCQGSCPGGGHLEALASGTAADALAERFARERPEGDLGRAAAAGRPATRAKCSSTSAPSSAPASRASSTCSTRRSSSSGAGSRARESCSSSRPGGSSPSAL